MRTLAIAVAVSVIAAVSAHAQFGETMTVARVLVDVRVTNSRGEQVTGLTADDFTARIGGAASRVESATFVDESIAARIAYELDEAAIPDAPAPPASRLFVVFVQTDFGRAASRVAGQMQFNRYVEHFIEALAPDDRVAVFSFDSHLKFRLDFTSDKERVADTIRASLLIDEPPAPPIVHAPALASRLDRALMKRVVSSEAALLLVGNALIPIEGPKNLILLGWGLGQMSDGVVSMLPEWKAARRALDAARTTIFAFDTTVADYHSLETGLRNAAEETGGFYAKTHVFPEMGLERLERTLRGRYELELRVPASLAAGTHELSLGVKRRGAIVLAPSSVLVK
jgi:VWFA-related protein